MYHACIYASSRKMLAMLPIITMYLQNPSNRHKKPLFGQDHTSNSQTNIDYYCCLWLPLRDSEDKPPFLKTPHTNGIRLVLIKLDLA